MATVNNTTYSIVNDVTAQAMGAQALAVIDNSSLIALGSTVLSSTANTENWTNTLLERIGKTIISQRRYNRKYHRMLRDDFEWGAILQKIKVDMPDAEADQSVNLANGDSVDMYKVNKQKIHQKLFVSNNPWQLHISVKRVELERAFTSEIAMNSFIGAKFTEVQNKIDLALEQLSMECVNNFIGEVNSTPRKINLLAGYNKLYGTTLTADKAFTDDAFLRYAVKEIKLVSDRMTRMTKGMYNDGTTSRFTPYELQNLYISSDYERSLETVTQYQAFRDKYVQLSGYETIPFWQNILEPNAISIKRASDSTAVTVNNVLGVLFDYEALGTYKSKGWSASTPMNPAGGYINYYWHFNDMYFNDLSENFVVFTVEDINAVQTRAKTKKTTPQ